MPLFVCPECHCVENTACGGYWHSIRRRNPGGVPLCSACCPEIGQWHGKFPREQYEPLVHGWMMNIPGSGVDMKPEDLVRVWEEFLAASDKR